MNRPDNPTSYDIKDSLIYVEQVVDESIAYLQVTWFTEPGLDETPFAAHRTNTRPCCSRKLVLGTATRRALRLLPCAAALRGGGLMQSSRGANSRRRDSGDSAGALRHVASLLMPGFPAPKRDENIVCTSVASCLRNRRFRPLGI